MVKLGIMICDRNRKCTGNKCFKALLERDGVFTQYPEDEPIEVVGWITCGGCPGERLEFSPADMKKYGAKEVLLATCYLAGYPPCPYIEDHIRYIEDVVGLPVRVGTHPMPQNYIEAHTKRGDWKKFANYLRNVTGDRDQSIKYDSTRPDYLKK